MHSLLGEDRTQLHFYLFKLSRRRMSRTQQEKPPAPLPRPPPPPNPLLGETTISAACSICSFACGNEATIKNPSFIFTHFSLPRSGPLTGRVQSAADQTLPVRRERKRHAVRLGGLKLRRSAESHQNERWSPCIHTYIHTCMHVCGHTSLSLFFFYVRVLWISIPHMRCWPSPQNKQWRTEPLVASAHTAFLRHCMKIDGFDIISKASLSHTPAVEGDRMRSTGPFCPRHCSDTYTQFVSTFAFIPSLGANSRK